jgi:hypothetical protein
MTTQLNSVDDAIIVEGNEKLADLNNQMSDLAELAKTTENLAGSQGVKLAPIAVCTHGGFSNNLSEQFARNK